MIGRLAGAGFIVLALGACQFELPEISSPFTSSTSTSQAAADVKTKPRDAAKHDGDSQIPRFTQFTDIPIPANAEVDLDNLLVLGSEDGWIGRLALKTDHDMTDMYAFYEREMPRFGWEQITIIRSAVSTLTYSRGGRIATITLQSRATGGAHVDFTVAPGTNPMAVGRDRKSATPASGSRRGAAMDQERNTVGASG
jgi:hypothetical protein